GLAAKKLIVTVEEMVDAFPPMMNAVMLPSWLVTAVVVCKGGAYPSYAQQYYPRDNAFYQSWDAIARDRETFLAWMQTHVLALESHHDFLQLIHSELSA
nr:CoA transferase subunit A [Arenimonas sp.]